MYGLAFHHYFSKAYFFCDITSSSGIRRVGVAKRGKEYKMSQPPEAIEPGLVDSPLLFDSSNDDQRSQNSRSRETNGSNFYSQHRLPAYSVPVRMAITDLGASDTDRAAEVEVELEDTEDTHAGDRSNGIVALHSAREQYEHFIEAHFEPRRNKAAFAVLTVFTAAALLVAAVGGFASGWPVVFPFLLAAVSLLIGSRAVWTLRYVKKTQLTAIAVAIDPGEHALVLFQKRMCDIDNPAAEVYREIISLSELGEQVPAIVLYNARYENSVRVDVVLAFPRVLPSGDVVSVELPVGYTEEGGLAFLRSSHNEAHTARVEEAVETMCRGMTACGIPLSSDDLEVFESDSAHEEAESITC